MAKTNPVNIWSSGCHLMEVRGNWQERELPRMMEMFCILVRVNPLVKTHGIVYIQLIYFNIYNIYLKRYKQTMTKKCTPSLDGFTSEFFQNFKEGIQILHSFIKFRKWKYLQIVLCAKHIMPKYKEIIRQMN